jgi:hypothetical protein
MVPGVIIIDGDGKTAPNIADQIDGCHLDRQNLPSVQPCDRLSGCRRRSAYWPSAQRVEGCLFSMASTRAMSISATLKLNFYSAASPGLSSTSIPWRVEEACT